MSPQSGRVIDDQQHIRSFIQQRFNDEELRSFCLDYFPPVHSEFTIGMTYGQMVNLLVEYCRRHNQFPELMAALQRERPEPFKQHFSWQERQSTPTPQSYTPKQRNPKQIFLSHAHQDADFAQKLAKDLKARGWLVWIAPDSIRPGERWIEAINRGLEESGIFLVVSTPAAVISGWVRREVDAAILLEHEGLMRVIPLDVKSATVPLFWRTYQQVPFHADYKTGLQELLDLLLMLDPSEIVVPLEGEGAFTYDSSAAGRIKRLLLWVVLIGAAVILLLIAVIWLPRAFPGAGNSDEPTATITRESRVAGSGVEATAETPSSESSVTLQATAAFATETETPTRLPTPIPVGELVQEIMFSTTGEGFCGDYDANFLGYEDGRYYINPGIPGFIAVCHLRNNLEPQGSLQVTAFLEGRPAEFGYAVLFGWDGTSTTTTDACMIGIRRRPAGSEAYFTEAYFSERVGGQNFTTPKRLPGFSLDHAPHTLRVVLDQDGVAYAYLDEIFFAQHQFGVCGTGPIGMVAWGPGENKVYFDNLKLFELP